MVRSIFITGTGTDVGKTYVSGLMVKKMHDYGLNCGYFKPVLSGAVRDNISNELIPEDCKHVADVSGLGAEPMRCLSYCFEEPLSPHLASKRAGVKISKTKIIGDYERYKRNYDYVLLEGAGGITCPLVDDGEKVYLLSDLIKDMSKDIVLVSESVLGSINSALTTVEYAKSHGITVRGIILNNYDKDEFMHHDNKMMIEKLTGVNVLAVIRKGETDINVDKETLMNLFKED